MFRFSFFFYFSIFCFFFFFNDTATTEIYTLSLHDALPISRPSSRRMTWLLRRRMRSARWSMISRSEGTRLNSSHSQISYAVFCLKKKKKKKQKPTEIQPHTILLSNMQPHSCTLSHP